MTGAYDIKHQRTRTKLLAELRNIWRDIDAGADIPPPICPRCGGVMRPYEPIQLGHSTSERKALGLPGDRLEHGSCNMAAGAQSQHDATHPAGYTPSQRW
jgi:hypothetical protein